MGITVEKTNTISWDMTPITAGYIQPLTPGTAPQGDPHFWRHGDTDD